MYARDSYPTDSYIKTNVLLLIMMLLQLSQKKIKLINDMKYQKLIKSSLKAQTINIHFLCKINIISWENMSNKTISSTGQQKP